jgi:hypothetical protein
MADRSSGDAGEAPPTHDLEASRSGEPAPGDLREPVPVERETDPAESLGRPGRADDPTSFDAEAPEAVGEGVDDRGSATVGDHGDADLSGLVPGSDLDSDPFDGVDAGLTPADTPLDTDVERGLGGLDGSFDPAADFLDGVGPDPTLQDLDPSAAGDEPVEGAGTPRPAATASPRASPVSHRRIRATRASRRRSRRSRPRPLRSLARWVSS